MPRQDVAGTGPGSGLRGVVAALPDGVVVVDGQGRIRFANPAACELLGRPLASLAGAAFGFPVAGPEAVEIELPAAGRPGIVEMRTRAGWWAGEPVMVVALRDVTARAHALAQTEEAVRQGLHDPLTGLPNRALLLDRLHLALRRADRSGRTVTVMFIDLDDFKPVNDRLGHDAGDQVLCALARRIQAAVRPADTVCRLGGDEFVVVCEGLAGESEAAEIATRIERTVAAPCPVEGQEVVLTTSVGVAVSRPRATPESLVADADAAMYRAKQEGKAGHHLFDDAMRVQEWERARLERGLQGAAGAGRLRLAYQPIVNLVTGAVEGVEALLRYDDPDEGTLPAERFISVAERRGLLVELGAWALEQACRDAARWHRSGPQWPVTVNVGPPQLADGGLAPAVRRALDGAALAPGRLWLDLTERAVSEASGTAVGTLSSLDGTGVRLGVDAWGTGTTSVTALARLPVAYVKLDRSVVSGLPAVRATAAALVSVARALGLTAVASGIETAEQLTLLRELGCSAGQGRLLGPPLAPAGLVSRLRPPAPG